MRLTSLLKSTVVAVFVGFMLLLGPAPQPANADDTQADELPLFARDVVPLLTRLGCNAGACHGKLSGQNGFKLSLRGYAPEQDFHALAREARGRRINPAAPEASLMISKATGAVPHGGGTLLQPGTRAYQVLVDWIAAGAPPPQADEPELRAIEISPSQSQTRRGDQLTLQVFATYSDGARRDVTWLTCFESSDPGMLEVDPEGSVRVLRNGEAVVRATLGEQVVIATITAPYPAAVDPQLYVQRENFVDDHVMAKLQSLRLEPAGRCDDATFIRRAFVDTIGTLPRVEEVRAFLADNDADKRTRLVDALLDRPEFVDYWTQWFGDLLQNRKERDHDVRGSKGVRGLHYWIREQLAAERPWDQIARDAITAEGDSSEDPQVGYLVVTIGESSPEKSEVVDAVAQTFLGTRIGCARCHNHPLESFTQDDFYHFAGFFSRVHVDRSGPLEGPTRVAYGTRHTRDLQRQIGRHEEELNQVRSADPPAAEKVAELEKKIAELGAQIQSSLQGPVGVSQPRTGEFLAPQTLDRGAPAIAPGTDPRVLLADWMTDPENELFAGAMVNRLWKHFFGAGLVEPVDDLRATNPPSNQALWDALIGEFTGQGYDLKHMMRLMLTSRTYQLASSTSETNATDTRFYSHYYARRLRAEVLLDAVSQATGVAAEFPGYPLGMRAIQLPDPAVDSYFLTLFGRSERVTACACERQEDVTLPQLLHLQNGDSLSGKITDPQGRLWQLLEAGADDHLISEELFLAAFGRLPTPEELAAVEQAVSQSSERREAFQDVFWALLNAKDFAFNH